MLCKSHASHCSIYPVVYDIPAFVIHCGSRSTLYTTTAAKYYCSRCLHSQKVPSFSEYINGTVKNDSCLTLVGGGGWEGVICSETSSRGRDTVKLASYHRGVLGIHLQRSSQTTGYKLIRYKDKINAFE